MYVEALVIHTDSFGSITESTIAVIIYFIKEQILNSWPLSGHQEGPPTNPFKLVSKSPYGNSSQPGPCVSVVQEGPRQMTPGKVSSAGLRTSVLIPIIPELGAKKNTHEAPKWSKKHLFIFDFISNLKIHYKTYQINMWTTQWEAKSPLVSRNGSPVLGTSSFLIARDKSKSPPPPAVRPWRIWSGMLLSGAKWKAWEAAARTHGPDSALTVPPGRLPRPHGHQRDRALRAAVQSGRSLRVKTARIKMYN